MEKKEISTAAVHRLILKGGAARVGDEEPFNLRFKLMKLKLSNSV